MTKVGEFKLPPSSMPDGTQSDMTQVVKVVLLRVANKTTSRYGVTLFLFCSSVWILTQAFLAVHNGCWISNPEVLLRIREKQTSRNCEKAAGKTGSVGNQQDERKQQANEVGATFDPWNQDLEKRNLHPIPLGDEVFKHETVRATRIENVQGEEDHEFKQTQDDFGQETIIKPKADPYPEPTRKPYNPLPFGGGTPVLIPSPYKLPENVSRNVVKITKETWATMGCTQRVTIFVPGVKNMPKDDRWREISESFKKFRMGYYLLKCPDQVCDLIVRTGATAKSVVSGNAVLVGASTKIMSNKTKSIMQDVKRLTPDNLLKIYLFTLDDSPIMNYYEPYMANFEYHYSMTYHSQADVPIPYGRYLKGVGAESPRNWGESRTALVAWVEDNCDQTFWPRSEYVDELKKHIPVDIFGRCGDRTCASAHCLEELKAYKFYLALEEAPCDEFITQAFWQRAIQTGAVPVVYGGKKYSYTKVAPPDSFIHIADYDSPAELARFLLRVGASDEEYNRFHQWRTEGSIDVSLPGFKVESLCRMVPQLIHVSPPRRKVMSRGKFYRSCRKGIYVNGFASKGDLSNWSPWR